MKQLYEKNSAGLFVPVERPLIKGHYFAQLIRDGKVIDEWEQDNLIVNQGLDHILSTEFIAGGQVTAWFLAPFTGNYVPVSTDTAASFPGNATESTAYTSSTRVPYVCTEGGQTVTNIGSPANFTFNASATVYGAFLTSASAKSSVSGTLFSAAQFSAPKSVVNADQLLLTYAVTLSSS